MAAVSSASAATTAFRPPSSNNHDVTWDYPSGASEYTASDGNGATRHEHTTIRSLGSQGGNSMSSKMPSDSFGTAASGNSGNDGIALSTALATEPQADHPVHPSDEHKRHMQQTLGLEYSAEDSKWIHRDKLAKIESEELQAAGFFVPRVRASSKQRRVRGQRSIDSVRSRHRHDSVSVDHHNEEVITPAWDLRTPEEIAEEEEKAYFASHSLRGGTRIPVARISPAPIPQDFLERNSPSARRIDSTDGDTIAYTKTRSRSASTSTKELDATFASNRVVAKRSVTDTSPKKMSARKTSTASKTGGTTVRSKSRSGLGRDGSRPITRSGDSFAASYQPEGEPPWVFDSYKPDPRLPPDQQLLPTVAKRLRQEQWEKEGKFGNAYDRDFRPLNDHAFRQAEAREGRAHHDDDGNDQAQTGDWPLKTGAAKSPKQTSYSTMPKISDRPPVGSMTPMTPMTSPKTSFQPPAPSTTPQADDVAPAAEAEPKVETKHGCGCCTIM
ncbi:hypothetical protein E4U22_004041 [Claviceps purpurea]|uniref:TeaA receptor TeaR n=1 Tax=Claviceps purpurea (strain 20.1) TaxID=1111077 RepID=M1VU52_CLAP2|nr:hypothetical protein E4U36_001538 [Claviceps purpurea]KAG6319835.1 hypothetical protein E4U22_004041 [Claviceps purpurea]CCE27167.1 uncharacterized protein CPUR_00639 [Claviceps purpurea 20.1]